MNGPRQPRERYTATLPLFGRRLRGHFGDAVTGLDDSMIALLEKLLEVPGVAEGAGRAPVRPVIEGAAQKRSISAQNAQ
jgi:hypothetical protein